MVDLTAVEEADISLVQLLASADASARLDDKSVVLSAPANGAVRDVLERGGFCRDEHLRRFWLATESAV